MSLHGFIKRTPQSYPFSLVLILPVTVFSACRQANTHIFYSERSPTQSLYLCYWRPRSQKSGSFTGEGEREDPFHVRLSLFKGHFYVYVWPAMLWLFPWLNRFMPHLMFLNPWYSGQGGGARGANAAKAPPAESAEKKAINQQQQNGGKGLNNGNGSIWVFCLLSPSRCSYIKAYA